MNSDIVNSELVRSHVKGRPGPYHHILSVFFKRTEIKYSSFLSLLFVILQCLEKVDNH